MKSFGRPRKRSIRGKPSRYYYVPVYDRTTRKSSWKSTGCTSVQAAREWVRSKEVEQALGGRPSDRPVAVVDAITAWIESKQGAVSPKRLEDLERARRLWSPRFGGSDLGEVRPDHLRSYLKDRSSGRVTGRPISPNSVNSELRDLRAFFNFCVQEGWVSDSPAVAVKPFSAVVRRTVRYLSREQEADLLAACRGQYTVRASRGERGWEQSYAPPEHLHLMVLIALRCGFRKRTILLLRWSHIDFKGKLWRIPAEIMKTRSDYQQPIPASVTEALLERRPTAGIKGRVFEGVSEDSSVRRAFASAAKRAGLEGMTFHDCRRAYLNRLRELGVSIETAMALTGHKSLQTVLKHYREVPIQDAKDATDLLG
ncbi:MAG: hypothetical protein DHS20C21_19380 [Gemmatimonadota bacterium]|nr:MAG: hypothetical protein DHS20C21_19380 [Gemmatimonadota bacterium]